MPDEEQVHETVEQWTERNKKAVRAWHGTIVGTAVIIGAFILGNAVLADGELTMIEAVLVGGLAIAGFVASMPWIFMPLIDKGLNYKQNRKAGS